MIFKDTKDSGKFLIVDVNDLRMMSSGSYVDVPELNIRLRFDSQACVVVGQAVEEFESKLSAGRNYENFEASIKPCPMCGGKAEYKDNEPRWSVVKCKTCRFKITGCASRGKDPVKKWNDMAPIAENTDEIPISEEDEDDSPEASIAEEEK